MNIPGIQRDLHWWHAMTGVAAAALIACIARGWYGGATISAGVCGIALGIWALYPIYTEMQPVKGGTVTYERPVFKAGWLGFLLWAVGLIVTSIGIWMATEGAAITAIIDWMKP